MTGGQREEAELEDLHTGDVMEDWLGNPALSDLDGTDQGRSIVGGSDGRIPWRAEVHYLAFPGFATESARRYAESHGGMEHDSPMSEECRTRVRRETFFGRVDLRYGPGFGSSGCYAKGSGGALATYGWGRPRMPAGCEMLVVEQSVRAQGGRQRLKGVR